MVVGEPNINNIMGGIENTGSVRLHNHRKKLKQRFDLIKKLGQGTYGKVQLGINKETGQEVAIKTIKKSKIETEADLVRIRREIQIMSSVQHPNIIHIYEVFENREKMVLVMEYAAGGELYDYLSERKVLVEEEARRIFRQISTACYYCHKHKICHRDLKLENILLDENGNAKIADFGLSNVFDEQRLLSTFCGSPLYASPEIVKGTPYHGPEVDCWSLGVLLYTLVYGAMPFDGSNFKRLVKQISQGDYFEPKTPSRASPLIKDMLTVNPRNRADIERICSHWWVNETYDESCLDISEELANQTPVRLDLLLSLAPPAPQLESEKLVVTGEIADENPANAESTLPTRSQSAGSLMDLSHPAERRIKDLLIGDVKVTPKRKLETTVSTDQINLSNEGVKRKDKIVKENTIADITVHAPIQEDASEDTSMAETVPLNKSLTQTLSRDMDVEPIEQVDPSTEGAACAEIIADAKKNEAKTVKVKKIPTPSINNKIVEENKQSTTTDKIVNKENIKEKIPVDDKTEDKQKPEESKIPSKRKVIKKKVLTDKNENAATKSTPTAELKSTNKAEQKSVQKVQPKPNDVNKVEINESKTEEGQPSTKPVERRRSRIFETAEKFQNMIAANEGKPAVTEKQKKILIPGVSVDGFKKEFERKASLTSTSPPKGKIFTKKNSIDEQQHLSNVETKESLLMPSLEKEASAVKENKEDNVSPRESSATAEDRRTQVRNAVSIISSALDKEGTRKSKSRPCMGRKPPIPFGSSGRSASANIGMMSPPLSPPADKTRPTAILSSTPAQVIEPTKEVEVPEEKTSSVEITLKSATLPRRKTTKAEIKLDYPTPKPATMEFKTEMAHLIENPPKVQTQKSEVIFPVSSPTGVGFRSASVEPETKAKSSPRERIIPISFESGGQTKKESPLSPPPKPPTFKPFHSQMSNTSQSLSRQSTQDSDSETTSSVVREPIRKSPREYIIPIAVEGGGYVTPRAGSLEPSDTSSTTSTVTNKSKFGSHARRMSSLLSDREGSEDESPFGTLHRHSSFGRDSDTDDNRRNLFRMHSLRSSRPRKIIEHNDSFSSGEDDDDDGFEILTAENLFSTLLSRVRDLTSRINVDGGRPGFPSSRLLSSHFDHGTNFWNLQNRIDPITIRQSPRASRTFSREPSADSTTSGQFTAPWRRSVSRDLATDINNVFKNSETPTHTATLPRGDKKTRRGNLNIPADLKNYKLSDEDAFALSYLTPGLSRRIQKQLLAQLAPSDASKLSRTLSTPSSSENRPNTSVEPHNKNTDCDNVTLPRRSSIESSLHKRDNYGNCNIDLSNKDILVEHENVFGINSNLSEPIMNIDRSMSESSQLLKNAHTNHSFLPVKSFSRDCSNSSYLDRNNRSDSVDDISNATEDRSSSFDKYKYTTNKAGRSMSIQPRSDYLSAKHDAYSSTSLDSSSMSERLLNNSKSPYAMENSRLGKYLSPPRTFNKSSSCLSDCDQSTSELRRPASTRKVSRFLRSDFYEGPKEENYYLKEKKERELETQKVLKEIRDKRKGKVRREEPVCKEEDNHGKEDSYDNSDSVGLLTESEKEHDCTGNLLRNVSDNIKTLETNISTIIPDYVNMAMKNECLEEKAADKETLKSMPDYVNIKEMSVFEQIPDYVNVTPTLTPVVKKERTSKIARPKSYPAENSSKEMSKIPSVLAKVAKTKPSKIKKNEKAKHETCQNEQEKQTNKNRFLQTIEKKIEKLRSFNNTPTSESSEDSKSRDERKSKVGDTIKRLREQSLPRNLEHCSTESGLIKRAVSVEDLPAIGMDSKLIQPSRKSVTKILGLFKKYEDQDKKTGGISKPKKTKDDNTKKFKSTNSQLKVNKTETHKKTKGADNVISNNKTGDISIRKTTKDAQDIPTTSIENNTLLKVEGAEYNETKPDRPRSLLFDRFKNFNSNDKDNKAKTSKLPVNLVRRSLNLDNVYDPSKFYKTLEDKPNNTDCPVDTNKSTIPDRNNLRLDFNKITYSSPESKIPSASSSNVTCQEENLKDGRNSVSITENNSGYLTPYDNNDASCDSWSVCSEFHTQDLTSPISPTSHFYSADENESVIDRIRRKSFYTRFNEKKRPRKSTVGSYRDLNLYKELSQRKPDYENCSENSAVDKGLGGDKISKRESLGNNFQSYRRNLSLLNGGYNNFPSRYHTYSPRSDRRSSSLYSPDCEKANNLDDTATAGNT